MNPLTPKFVTFCKAQLGKSYRFGRRGPNLFDCIGMMVAMARAAGLDETVFASSWTVRSEVSAARMRSRLQLAADGHTGERGQVFIWGSSADPAHRPIRGAGHTGLVLQPVSSRYPRGKAISAYNPDKGVIMHDLIPAAGSHLALYGFVDLSPELPAEIEDSAPATTDATQQVEPEPVDYKAMYEMLMAGLQSLVDSAP